MFGEEFDFEEFVESHLPRITDDTIAAEIGSGKVGEQKHRTIVCRHWLVGLCHHGNSCSYLHKLDHSRMPPCKHGKQCKIKNCPLRHVAEEELEECMFYKQGFCSNGPKCGRRHVKRTPEQCPAEYPFDATVANNLNGGKRLKAGQPNDNFKVTLCHHWLLDENGCRFGAECHYAHGEVELREGFQANSDFLRDDDIYDPTRGILGVPLELPFSLHSRCAYFVLQSPDLRSLRVSKRRGVWAVASRVAKEMNAVFRSMDYVIIFFSVRALRGIYGVALMGSSIPNVATGLPLSPEFPVKWIRTMRISLSTVAQLKLGSSGMFVGRSSIDGRFDSGVGLDLLLSAFRKPVWDWTTEMERAEMNIRLIDPALLGMPQAAPVGEYYPINGQPAYYLPEDVLFAQDWIERSGLEISQRGVPMRPGDRGEGDGRSSNYNPRMDSQSSSQSAAPADFYRGEHSGFIVCAPSAMIEEMFSRMLFGLPMDFKDINIQPNVPLFIFDTQANIMLGIFFANSPVTMNLDPRAFGGWNQQGSPYPVQLQFKHAMECPPVQIQIQDPELHAALGEALKTMGQIGVKETQQLANLFARRAYAAYPHLLTNVRKRPMHIQGNMMGNTFYKPPFRCVQVLPIDIPGNPFEVRRRVLGANASNVMQIVEGVGNKQTVRVRMRGIGSGFVEGPSQEELPEPLHLNVSTENEQLMSVVVSRLQELIERVRRDLSQ